MQISRVRGRELGYGPADGIAGVACKRASGPLAWPPQCPPVLLGTGFPPGPAPRQSASQGKPRAWGPPRGAPASRLHDVAPRAPSLLLLFRPPRRPLCRLLLFAGSVSAAPVSLQISELRHGPASPSDAVRPTGLTATEVPTCHLQPHPRPRPRGGQLRSSLAAGVSHGTRPSRAVAPALLRPVVPDLVRGLSSTQRHLRSLLLLSRPTLSMCEAILLAALETAPRDALSAAPPLPPACTPVPAATGSRPERRAPAVTHPFRSSTTRPSARCHGDLLAPAASPRSAPAPSPGSQSSRPRPFPPPAAVSAARPTGHALFPDYLCGEFLTFFRSQLKCHPRQEAFLYLPLKITRPVPPRLVPRSAFLRGVWPGLTQTLTCFFLLPSCLLGCKYVCPFCASLYIQNLEECLAHSRFSIDIGWMIDYFSYKRQPPSRWV